MQVIICLEPCLRLLLARTGQAVGLPASCPKCCCQDELAVEGDGADNGVGGAGGACSGGETGGGELDVEDGGGDRFAGTDSEGAAEGPVLSEELAAAELAVALDEGS